MNHTLLAGFVVAVIATGQARAQGTQDQQELLLFEATPIGALPPIPLPMPASRNHNYWGFRIQSGHREGPGESAIPAVGVGIDWQYRGGSVIGVTGGWQKRDCGILGADCGGHAFYGLRSRINVLTGGQSIGSLVHDYSSTTTVGGEWGLGYAPDVQPGVDACTIDLGMPITVSLGQRLRIATFLTPGIMWDMSCSDSESPSRPSYLTGFGVGLQQLGNRGLDVYLGLQKIFRRESELQIGLSVTYVMLR